MKKTLIAVLLAAAVCLVACGGSSSSSSSADSGAASSDSGTTTTSSGGSGSATYTLKIGHSDTTANLIHTTLEQFAEYVNEQTDGAVQIDIYASEQLGSNAEMAEMVEMGSLDALMLPQGNIAQYAPKMNTLGLPFMFNNYEEVWAVLDSDLGDEFTEGLADHNMIQLAYWENGLRQITNNVRPIEQPSDLQGLKIRTPEDAITVAIFNALGASPSPLAASEMYLALQQGTFDGQENPIANIDAFNLKDVQKYLSMTNHKYECKNMIFSLSTWNSLPEDIQEVLSEAAVKYGKVHREAIADSEMSILEELGETMEINYPDPTPFIDATQSVYTDFYADNDWAEDLVSRMQDVIATVD